jgi:hypothetical protein
MIDLQAPSLDGAQGRTFDVLVAGAALLGVVANGFKSGRRGSYGNGYYNDYAAGGGGATAGVKAGLGPASASSTSPNGAATADEPVPTVKG